jgi:hypothetical protein
VCSKNFEPRLIVIKFSRKVSGGNILLDEFCSDEYPNAIRKNFVFYDSQRRLNVFRGIIVAFQLSYDLFTCKAQSGVRFVFTDPILSILELFSASRNIDRLVQSIDDELYDGHPKVPILIQKFIKMYVQYFLTSGRSDKFVYSALVGDYLSRRGLPYERRKVPLVIPHYRSQPSQDNVIISIMSNPWLKNIDLLNRIASDFQSLKFVVLTPKKINIEALADNLSLKVCDDRSDLFKALSSCLCHLSVSRKESLGLPIFEAMAAHVPSVFLENTANKTFSERTPLAFQSYESVDFGTMLDLLHDPTYRKKVIGIQEDILNEYVTIKR